MFELPFEHQEPLPGERFHAIEEMIDDIVAHHRDPNDLTELHTWWQSEAELAKADPLLREPVIRLVAEKTHYLAALGHSDSPLGNFLFEKAAELEERHPEEWRAIRDRLTPELTA